MYIINVKGKLNILYVVVVFIICCVFYTFHYSGLVPWYLQVCFIVNCKFVKKKNCVCVCVLWIADLLPGLQSDDDEDGSPVHATHTAAVAHEVI